MTDPNAISSTPETSGGEDGFNLDDVDALRELIDYARHDARYDAVNAQARRLVRKLESRLSPPSSSGEDGNAVTYRPFNAEQFLREMEEAAPKLRAALEAIERAKHVTQALLRSEVTI